jgi:hypothetical protein
MHVFARFLCEVSFEHLPITIDHHLLITSNARVGTAIAIASCLRICYNVRGNGVILAVDSRAFGEAFHVLRVDGTALATDCLQGRKPSFETAWENALVAVVMMRLNDHIASIASRVSGASRAR